MVSIDFIEMKKCRLCHLNTGEIDIDDDKDLVEQIFKYTQINVNDEVKNRLPPKICDDCKFSLTEFEIFLKRIKSVDQLLRTKIAINNILIVTASNDIEKEQDIYICDKCTLTFSSINNYKKHLKGHEAKFQCLQCKQLYVKKKNYEIHLKTHRRHEKKVSNEISTDDHSFADIGGKAITEEKRKLGGDKSNFACTKPDCEIICSSARALKSHELKHEGKTFLCVTCGKGFNTKNSLTCHEKIHLEVKGYTCKLCNIGFSVRSNLRAHEKKYHEGVRFICSQCSREFLTKYNLERHERIHTGIKEFQCDSCPSAFYTNKELLKHQRYHQGLRLHKCEQCFKTFFERHHLIIHIRSHTGERPYVCTVPNCGKSFTESQKLKRHFNSKHSQT